MLEGPHCLRKMWEGQEGGGPGGGAGGRRVATFAGAVWAPEHSALVYGPERLEHLPDVFICLLLP